MHFAAHHPEYVKGLVLGGSVRDTLNLGCSFRAPALPHSLLPPRVSQKKCAAGARMNVFYLGWVCDVVSAMLHRRIARLGDVPDVYKHDIAARDFQLSVVPRWSKAVSGKDLISPLHAVTGPIVVLARDPGNRMARDLRRRISTIHVESIDGLRGNSLPLGAVREFNSRLLSWIRQLTSPSISRRSLKASASSAAATKASASVASASASAAAAAASSTVSSRSSAGTSGPLAR
jgi:hypothetical protein